MNDAISVVGYERSNGIEEDARTIRSKTLDSWPMNDAYFNGVIKKSNQAHNANVFTRERKGKMPQRPKSSLSDAVNVIDYKRAKDTESDAQTVRNILLNPGSLGDARSLDDDMKLGSDERFIHIEDDPLVIQRSTTFGWEYFAPLREETDDENKSLTDKRRPGSITSVTKSHTAAMVKKALPKLSLPPSFPMTIGRGLRSMIMRGTNLQSPPSAIAPEYLQKNFKVVLLGTSGAGKSTLWKSMTVCYEGSLGSHNERVQDLIYRSLMEDIRTTSVAMEKFNDDYWRISLSAKLSDDVVSAIKAFWDDSDVQAFFRMSNWCELNDPSG